MFALCAPVTGRAQPAPAANDVSAQLRALAEQLAQMRQELAEARRESADLRNELTAVRQQVTALRSSAAGPTAVVGGLAPRTGAAPDLDAEERELLAAKVEDQYQTKVESGSKYRVKLSGIALLQASAVSGAVDNLDLPFQATPKAPGESGGAVGASVRQSIIGLDVTGPTLAGAATHGEVRVDFFGGLPSLPDGATSGFVRLRTAKFTMDWGDRTLEAGQDVPFFSPLSPSSLAVTAYPALSSAGNLWAWTPQVHMTHRKKVTDSATFALTYGVLDALTGQLPGGEYSRSATAGERSRMPAYAMRVSLLNDAARKNSTEGRASAGLGAYYSRQNWGFSRRTDAWAATADFEIPIYRHISLTGELYRGRSIGGLGGGAGVTLLRSGDLSSIATRVLPLDSAGGWAQLKYKPAQRWEFNLAYGADLPFRLPRAGFAAVLESEEIGPRRNRSAFGNVIYQPRNNLLFSVEYRKLWTTPFDAPRRSAGHATVAAGILF